MSVRCKFGASELRLNMLDPCLPLEYPVNVYKDVFDPREAAEYEHLASLAERGEWEAVAVVQFAPTVSSNRPSLAW